MRRWWLLWLCATAGATEPCVFTYDLGSTAFDGDGSLSLLSPESGQLVWTRISGGASTVVAQTSLPPLRDYYTQGSWIGHPIAFLGRHRQ